MIATTSGIECDFGVTTATRRPRRVDVDTVGDLEDGRRYDAFSS
jgi:hypothetical protein